MTICFKNLPFSLFFSLSQRSLVTDYLRCYYRKQGMISCAYENAIEFTCGPEEEIIVKDLLFMEKMRLSVFPQQRQRVYSMSRFEGKKH